MKITPLIISYKSLEKLKKCIETIGPNIKIIVIENSKEKKIKDYIEKHFQNCKVMLNNSNLGYSKASNIGFKLIKTDYALLLNTDVIIKESQIKQMEEITEELSGDFTLASPISDDLIDFTTNNKLDKFFDKKDLIIDPKEKITKVDLVKGCSLLVNLKKFENEKIFDDNYFFFFEEIDLCRKIKKKNEKIYIFNQIKIEHKSAQSLDENYNDAYHNFRNWNYFWGSFYYFKKHYGFMYSLLKHLGKLVRFGVNMIRFYFISETKFEKNKYRFFGLFESIIGKRASKSNQILEKVIKNYVNKN